MFPNILKKMNSNNVSKNAMALYIIQIFSMVAPLIVLPYLSRMLGVEGFGKTMLIFSLCAIAVVITDYGFNLSATYSISKNRDDKTYVSELIGAIYVIKIVITCALLTIIFILNDHIGIEIEDKNLYLYIALNIFAQAFIPTWFFHGIEKMKNVTIFMSLSKMTYVILIFCFVEDVSDVNLVVLLYATSNIIAVLTANSLIYSNGYSINQPRIKNIGFILKDSSQYFLSRASVTLYTTASTFLVGTNAGMQQAAFYSSSEKIYQAFQSITGPIAQALFPYMANNKDTNILTKVLVFIGIPLSLFCIIGSYWASDIMSIIFGHEFREASYVLQLFLIIAMINFISVIYGYPAFASIGRVNLANYSVMLGAFIQGICLIILFVTDNISALNIVNSILITEIIVMIVRLILYKNFK